MKFQTHLWYFCSSQIEFQNSQTKENVVKSFMHTQTNFGKKGATKINKDTFSFLFIGFNIPSLNESYNWSFSLTSHLLI